MIGWSVARVSLCQRLAPRFRIRALSLGNRLRTILKSREALATMGASWSLCCGEEEDSAGGNPFRLGTQEATSTYNQWVRSRVAEMHAATSEQALLRAFQDSGGFPALAASCRQGEDPYGIEGSRVKLPLAMNLLQILVRALVREWRDDATKATNDEEDDEVTSKAELLLQVS